MISRETSSKNQEISTSSDNNNNNNNNAKNFKPSSSSTTTTTTSSWSRFKDPRIVRVSKALGGKDRHSKVCTVRGLRDRRVRLSVPTAIQLYDLQERLGLNQPSKVVDWLLNAAKHEIDELPPLQIPQGMMNFGEHSNLDQTMLNFQDFRGSQSDKQGLNDVDRPRLNFFGGKSKDDEISGDRDETNWENHQGMMNSSTNTTTSNPYNSFVRFDPSNLSLSHHPPRISQHEDLHDFGLLPMQSTPSIHVSSGSHHHHHHHQVLVYHHQPAGLMMSTTQSYFPNSQIGVTNGDGFDSSTTHEPVRQIHFNMTANLLPTQDNNDGSN